MTTAARHTRLASLLVTIAALLSLLAINAGRAHGATPITGVCPSTNSYPFAAWGDTNPYFLVPGGDFEATSGWTLTGGAALVTGNEPFKVHGAGDSKALSLPPGSSATSPPTCITFNDPTIRFFAVGGDSKSKLDVTVTGTFLSGKIAVKPLSNVAPTTNWAPTKALHYFANALSLASANGTAVVQFTFTASGSTGWKVDDVYIDPRKGV